MSLSIVFEDNHLVVVDKPAGLATMGSAETEPSLARDVQAYLKHKYGKPGNVYLGVVSRLDSVTSGLIVFAKTSKAAARLTHQFRERTVAKWYIAAVPTVQCKKGDHAPTADSAAWYDSAQVLWEDTLWKDDDAHRMRRRRSTDRSDDKPFGAKQLGAKPDGAKQLGAKPFGANRSGQTESGDEAAGQPGQVATLRWRLLGRGPGFDLVLVQLQTGRKHQIRVQFAERGFPILGDQKYGSPISFPKGIALHSWRLGLTHPVTKVPLDFCQDLPKAWLGLPELGIQPDVPHSLNRQSATPIALLKNLAQNLRSA